MSLRRVFCAFATFGLCSFVQAASVAALPDFTELVERHGPAVVNISTSLGARGRVTPFPGIDENDPMFDFFRRFIPRTPDTPKLDPDNRSLGSGFVISSDGFILTNAHVVDEAEEIVVRLVDKREYRARVIGADIRSDVALIKIDANGLQRVVLGDPSRLKVGEWVVAIGSPFGFDHSVTAGIVSAKGRTLPDENFVPFIQSDVAINPGNSGGPLFNLKGEVIGINSQIYSQTGGFMGLSFAIPIDVAMDVQHQLRTTGRVQRGRIGVAIQEVTRSLAESFGLARPAGALVSSVEPGGAAALAGVEQGDVILRFGGKSVENSGDLPRIVAGIRPGSKVPVQLYRNGSVRDLLVTVGEWRDDPNPRATRAATKAQSAPNKLGVVVAQPSAAQRRERNGEQGLIIDRVQGAAARAELKSGDLLLGVVVNGRQVPMRSVEEFNRLVADIRDGQTVTLLVSRAGTSSYVALRAGE